MKGEPDPAAAWVEGLERIREQVRRRLELIERLARERSATVALPAGLADRERTLLRKAAELDEAGRRLRADSERWEQERRQALDQIEHDRRLLTEAWERLERERTAAPPAPTRSQVPDRPTPVVVRSVLPADQDDPIAREILRQFQALRRDVRRKAHGQPSG